MEIGHIKRMSLYTEGAGIVKQMLNMEQYVQNSGLEKSLIHLVKLRASQLNGCTYCIQMHQHEAISSGEDQQRLDALSAWENNALFSGREKAALAWTEAITNIQEGHASDEAYVAVNDYFEGEALANLTLLIITINGWNRLGIGFRMEYEHTGE